MILMGQVNLFRKFTLSLSLSLGLMPALVWAQQPVVKIRFDETTVSKGYTLSLDNMAIGIPPQAVAVKTKMWLRQKKKYPALPESLLAISPVYLYALKPAATSLNNEALWLSYALPTDEVVPQYERRFYYYNGAAAAWQPVDSTLDVFHHTVSAAWPLPYSVLVVADDTTDLLAPTKVMSPTDISTPAAASAIAIDEVTGAVLYSDHPNAVRSLASLTKIMTAYVLLEEEIDLTKEFTYQTSYNQDGARLYLSAGDIVTVENLMNAMVVGSANNAAYALVAAAGYTVPEFVQKMNDTAAELGLTETHFADPSGLDPNNTSTAADYAKFLRLAWQNDELERLSSTPFYEFTTKNTGGFHDFANTNWLMATTDLNITGSKTGYLDEALYSLAMRVTESDHGVITVLLGAPTSTERFSESEDLMRWSLENYSW